MLFKNNNSLDIKCTLNLYYAFGIHESGKLKTDRYDVNVNVNVKEDDINNFIQAIENFTGYQATRYTFNADKQKHSHNETRAIITLREPTEKTTMVFMPLRVTPAHNSTENLQALQAAFTALIGLVK